MVATECRDHHRLISPKVFKTRWRQLGISHRVLDILVPEVGLQGAGIVPPVRQCVPTGVAQHVWMHTELKLGPLDPVGPPFWRSPLG